MPTYFVGNPPDYPQLPLLEFFSGLEQEGYTSGTKLVGTLSSVADIDALAPAPNMRVELEYAEGEQEVRVVNNETGEYHQATGEAAKSILSDMEARQAVDLKEDGNYPGGHRRPDPHDKVYIHYDEDGKRIWPALRRAGICHTKEEFMSHDGGSVFWDSWHKDQDTSDEYHAIIDSRTGDYWVADPESSMQMRLEREIRKAQYMKEHPDSPAEHWMCV